MAGIISTTRPTDEGEMFWCVHFMGSYYDSDERAPGTVPIDVRAYVLAKGREEAIVKAEPSFMKARKRNTAECKIEATIVTIESLVAARDSSGDGRLGWHSTSGLAPVDLSCEDDKKKYRLGVCLIPVE
ncbi:MAG: hypothetical protein WC242_00950 [Candidatus Paceibacterota bacterium]|jgi:hypothetical protein